MRILLVASDPMEFRGILSRARDVRPVPMGVDWARSGRIGTYDAVFAANGVGRKRAAAAVDVAAAQWPPDAIVSTGFCGALDEKLAVAEIVAGTAILVSGRSWPAAPVSAAAPFRSGVVCSIDRVARTAAEKRELRRSGGCIVEMEAAGIVERAESLGIPFHCVRAVTDLAGETLANDYNSALRPDGHFATMLILRGALRQPTVRLPELLRLRSRCVRAARGLGDFIADCRF
jgi:adenosylhomocysteine nucleosidase